MYFFGYLRINSDNEWEISTDNGNHWTVMKDTSGNPVKATGAKGDKGDAIFSGIDYQTDPANVIFTLADGTTQLVLPRARTLTVGFDRHEVFVAGVEDATLPLVLPATLRPDDYTALVAEVKDKNGQPLAGNIATRTVSPEATIVKPAFENGVYKNNAAVILKNLGAVMNTGDPAILKVSLIDKREGKFPLHGC